MRDAIRGIVGPAVGVAISPVPVIALILMLFSKRAASNSVAFLFGWMAGLATVSAVVLAAGLERSEGEGDGSGGWVQIVVGVLLLAVAAVQWRRRPRAGDDVRLPAWMASIDEFTVVKAFGVAVLLSAVNPKNLGLTLAAATSISSAGLDPDEEALVAVVYVLLASSTLVVPVVGYLAARRRMAPALDSMKQWLTAHNATVMAVVFAVLGATVLVDGLAAIA